MLKRLCFSILFMLTIQLPAAAGTTPIAKIAFGAGLQLDQPQPVWGAVKRIEPDVFIFTDSNVYADTDTWNLNDAFQAFRATVPVIGAPMGNYRAELYGTPGRRVQVILLDTRSFRTPLKRDDTFLLPPRPYVPNIDPTATLLGRRQWNWLREQLLVPADVRLIVSSIQILPTEQPDEKWANFPYERKNLFAMLKELKTSGVIFISGGLHVAEISWEEAGTGTPLYEITSSSLNDREESMPKDRNSRRIGRSFAGNNFGLIDIDWDSAVPRISIEIRDEDGHIQLQRDILFSDLNITHE